MTPELTRLITILVLTGLLPFIAVIATSFTKISVSLLVIRNALGIQQTPPNSVLFGIALVLTMSIMAPVFGKCLTLAANTPTPETLADTFTYAEAVTSPWRDYLIEKSKPETREKIEISIASVPENKEGLSYALAVIVPAFLSDELGRAFQVGLLIYIPFVAIDLAIATILVAVGMQSVSPTVISAPAKIALFLAVEGWTKLIQNFLLMG